MESLPTEILEPNSIGSRCKKARSINNFDKQYSRDNTMYNQDSFGKNNFLDYSREERQKIIEDRKKNRHKYRTQFSKIHRFFRKGKRLNEVRTVSKFFHDGIMSEFQSSSHYKVRWFTTFYFKK